MYSKTKNYNYDSNEDDSDEENTKNRRSITQNVQKSNNYQNSDEDSDFRRGKKRNERDSVSNRQNTEGSKKLASNKSIKLNSELNKRLSNKTIQQPKLSIISTSQLKEIREIAQATRTMSINSSDDSTENKSKKLAMFDDKKNNNFIESDPQSKSSFIQKYKSINVMTEEQNMPDYKPNIVSNDKVIMINLACS
jgi:hypothetical protein